MKKQKVRDFDIELLLRGLTVNIEFYEYLIKDLFSDIPNIEEDILFLKNKYDLDLDSLNKIEETLKVKSSTKVKITNKSDLLMSEAFFLKSKLKLSKDIYDFETGVVDPFEIIEELKKLEKKLLKKLEKEAIQNAISTLENSDKTAETILSKIVKSDRYDISLKDIELYLKRAEAVKTARVKNSKVA